MRTLQQTALLNIKACRSPRMFSNLRRNPSQAMEIHRASSSDDPHFSHVLFIILKSKKQSRRPKKHKIIKTAAPSQTQTARTAQQWLKLVPSRCTTKKTLTTMPLLLRLFFRPAFRRSLRSAPILRRTRKDEQAPVVVVPAAARASPTGTLGVILMDSAITFR